MEKSNVSVSFVGVDAASSQVLISCWPASSHLLSVPPLAFFLFLSFHSFHLCYSFFHSKCPSSCEALQPCTAPCLLREREKLGLQLTHVIRASFFSPPFSTCLSFCLPSLIYSDILALSFCVWGCHRHLHRCVVALVVGCVTEREYDTNVNRNWPKF